MKERIFFLLKQFLILVLAGALSGVIVGLYQLGIQNIVKASTDFYTSKVPVFVACIVFLVGVCITFNYLILNLDKSVNGSGIPALKTARRNKQTQIWYKDIPLLIGNSYASTFAGFTLGSEGPSVVLASKTTGAINAVFKNKDETLEELAEGVGFGCAFLSPLAGVCYSLEESLESKITFTKILKVIILMAIAFLITSLINQNNLLTLANFKVLPLNTYYVFPFLLIINLLVSWCFIKIMLVLQAFFLKHKENALCKYRFIPLFLVTMILNFLILDFMQSGGKLIANIHNYTSLILLLGILLLRFSLTALSGNGNVTGGLVIPLMALGAINGEITSVISTNLFGLDSSYYEIIALISALMLFAFVVQTPFTSLTLLFSVSLKFNAPFVDSLMNLPLFALTLLIGYLLMSRLFKFDSLYEEMIKVNRVESEK